MKNWKSDDYQGYPDTNLEESGVLCAPDGQESQDQQSRCTDYFHGGLGCNSRAQTCKQLNLVDVNDKWLERCKLHFSPLMLGK